MSEPSSEPVDDGVGLPELDRVRPIPARASPTGSQRPGGARGGPPARGGGRGSGQNPPAEVSPPQRDRPVAPPPPPPKPVSEEATLRRFASGGVEWVARAAGYGSSGGVGRASAPLTLVTFELADRPDEPVREALRVGRDLSELSDGELAEIFDRSAPFARSWRRQTLFSETRVGKKGER